MKHAFCAIFIFQTRSSPDEPEELLFTGNIPRGVLLARNEP